MARPMRVLQPLQALRSLHTTPARATTQRDQLSGFLRNLGPSASASASGSASASSSAPKGSSSRSTAPQDAARSMIGSVGLRELENDGRRAFKPNKITPPHEYLPSSLHPRQRPMARPPLLGPPARIAKRIDPFLLKNSKPLEHALNPLMAMSFVNQIGKIKSRAETGLSWKSQRGVGKLVRRARAMGVVPRWASVPRPGGLGYKDFKSRPY